ncbi:hypothetical protein [Anaerocolumna jejuensis]|uniref:hypothetical protein n=1 Tax=Anaerocolumna jejuensis TaxID=259063 RepID=UPI003F7B4E39
MNNQTYIKILQDTLVKKNQILDELLLLTVQQEMILDNSIMDYEKFETCISQKEVLINQLNQLDDGFEALYERIRVELPELNEDSKGLILDMQNFIKDIMMKSTKLQALEHKNKLKLDLFLTSQKREIRTMKMNNKTTTSYYGNMSGQNLNNSFFFDKKK